MAPSREPEPTDEAQRALYTWRTLEPWVPATDPTRWQALRARLRRRHRCRPVPRQDGKVAFCQGCGEVTPLSPGRAVRSKRIPIWRKWQRT